MVSHGLIDLVISGLVKGKRNIDRVLINHESHKEVVLDLGLFSIGMLPNRIRDYRKNGYNVINRPIGRPNITKRKLNSLKM